MCFHNRLVQKTWKPQGHTVYIESSCICGHSLNNATNCYLDIFIFSLVSSLIYWSKSWLPMTVIYSMAIQLLSHVFFLSLYLVIAKQDSRVTLWVTVNNLHGLPVNLHDLHIWGEEGFCEDPTFLHKPCNQACIISLPNDCSILHPESHLSVVPPQDRDTPSCSWPRAGCLGTCLQLLVIS